MTTGALANVRILLIDDRWDTLNALDALLRVNGAQTSLAGGGPEALEKLRTFEPDLLISDLSMPEMDGLELIRTLRRSGWTMPALALSAVEDAGVRNLALAEGYARCLAKPVEPAVLIGAARDLARPE